MSESQTLFEQNLLVLEKRYPDFAAFLETLGSRQYPLSRSESGDPILRLDSEDQKEILIGDAVDPKKASKKLIPQNAHAKSLFVVMGMGLGHVLHELAIKYPESLFLVVEHDARIFQASLRCFDWRAYLEDERFEFVVAVKTGLMVNRFSHFFSKNHNSNYLPQLTLVSDPQVIQYSQGYYEKACHYMKHAIDFYWQAIVGNNYKDTLLGLHHTIHNLQRLESESRLMSVESLEGRYAEAIGVVVSSGPSLDAQLKFLKDLGDRAIIICADSALRLLLKEGIKPFGVCCLERDEVISSLFEDYEIPQDTVLFFNPQVSPKVLENFPGPKCAFFRNVFPFEAFDNVLPRTNLGISCSHFSLMVLMMLGCKKIGLLGQDLAFDRSSGGSHFGNYDDLFEQVEDPSYNITTVMVEGNDGQPIRTHEFWVLFRDFFEQILNNNPGFDVVNVIPKSSGVKINGAPCVEPKIFFDELKVQKRPDLPKSFESFYEVFQNKVDGFEQSFLSSMKDLKEGLDELQKGFSLFKECQSIQDYFIKQREFLNQNSTLKNYVLFSVCSSMFKRFDACAQSLWNDQEFLQHIPGHVDQVCQALSDTKEYFDKGSV